jgi:hypothetical protein
MIGFGNYQKQIKGDRLITRGLGIACIGTILAVAGYVVKSKNYWWKVASSEDDGDKMYKVYQDFDSPT